VRGAAGARAIVMFDGVCNFCNAVVRFIAANDPAGRFAFLSLQSPRARELLRAHPRSGAGGGAPGPHEPDTVVLLDYGRRYELSDAALHVALGLRMPWPLLFAAVLIPRAARDAAYRWIARNRYRWFGRMDACPLPPPGLRERFLDEAPASG
jgi:predicted DCC family thiol-disulfide oxidoreductase YuxK